ncbi:hypothetical protein EDD17DRAFT_532314 [Pisolithus thermaeus]|nr:hypothetical protein EV401DRAFT_1517479 [Pisolithus croceorrhizus]KAI6162917.1 hypothetical protein EDD17DRAFT_532314 [Pisolithus thermaeus]
MDMGEESCTNVPLSLRRHSQFSLSILWLGVPMVLPHLQFLDQSGTSYGHRSYTHLPYPSMERVVRWCRSTFYILPVTFGWMEADTTSHRVLSSSRLSCRTILMFLATFTYSVIFTSATCAVRGSIRHSSCCTRSEMSRSKVCSGYIKGDASLPRKCNAPFFFLYEGGLR